MKDLKWIAPIPPPWVEPYAVVWIDVAKLEASWKQTSNYIGVGGTMAVIGSRYEKFGKWLERGEPIEIPSLGLVDSKIEFTDGRHRFAWLRDHGVELMPVHVELEQAKIIKSQFKPAATPDWPSTDFDPSLKIQPHFSQ